METARVRSSDQRRSARGSDNAPKSAAELRRWVVDRFEMDEVRATELLAAIDSVVAGQRQLLEDSKHEAIRALTEGFAAKMERSAHARRSEVQLAWT